MYSFLLCLYNCCCYFFQFLDFTRISKCFLKLLCSTTINKVHNKNMLIINFANKQEKIIIMKIEKKIGINSQSGEKKSGKNTGREKGSRKKFRRGKILSLAKNFVISPRLFFRRLGILFSRAIIQILKNVEIVTYAFARVLGRGQPKFFF